MVYNSHIELITLTDERTCTQTECNAEYTEFGVSVVYSYGDGTVTLDLSGERARITRDGSDGYILDLVCGERTSFVCSAASVGVFTHSIIYKRTESGCKFTAKYSFDGGISIRIILTVTNKGRCEI